MTNNILNEKVVAELMTRIPQNKLADQLSDILDIEKSSVYRRLRGEVDFRLSKWQKLPKYSIFQLIK